MIVISHRGNLTGPDGDCRYDKVRRALDLGFDVELDVRSRDGELFVGHDRMLYPLSDLTLTEREASRVWFHAKDWRAAAAVGASGRLCFCHGDEESAFVANGYGHVLWMHPRVNPELSAADGIRDKVLLDVDGHPRVEYAALQDLPFAICTDWPVECHRWLSWKLERAT